MNYYHVRGSAHSKKTCSEANPKGWRINRNIGIVSGSVEGAIHAAMKIISQDADLSNWTVDQVNKMGEVDIVGAVHPMERGPSPDEVHFGSPYYVLEQANAELRIRNRDLLDLSKRLQGKIAELESQLRDAEKRGYWRGVKVAEAGNETLKEKNRTLTEKLSEYEQGGAVQPLVDDLTAFKKMVEEQKATIKSQLKRILDADRAIEDLREQIRRYQQPVDPFGRTQEQVLLNKVGQLEIENKNLKCKINEMKNLGYTPEHVERLLEEFNQLKEDIRTLFNNGLMTVVTTPRPPEVMDAVARVGRIIGKTKNGIPFCEKCGGYHNNHCVLEER